MGVQEQGAEDLVKRDGQNRMDLLNGANQNLCSPTNIIPVINSRQIRWAARMGHARSKINKFVKGFDVKI